MPSLLELLGQTRAVEHLCRALAASKLPHALLFVGPKGVGKVTAARALAQAMCCERPGEPGAACGECGPCRKVAGDVHPDLLSLVPGGAGNVIPIDAVRALAETLAFAPHESRVRFVIVDDADRLTDQAQNAVLKTLEEPPPGSHFVLCTAAPDKLLVTIRSRCQQVRFAPLDAAALAEILARAGVAPPRAQAAAALAGGSATRAAELAEAEVLERRRERAGALLAAARAPGWRAAVTAAGDLAQAKEDVLPTLDLLAHIYRDAAALAAGAAPDSFAGRAELAVEASRSPGPAALARRAAVVLETEDAVVTFANAQLALERMLVALRGMP